MGKASANVLFDPVHNSCCDLDVEKNPELKNFSSILDFMDRIPIKKALTDQRPIYRSHLSRFWKNATYDEQSKVISSVVEVHGKLETILVTEALVREVINFPDEADYPTRFPERMVKGCMLRMGYRGALNTGNYLKSKFQKSFKFLIHCILISLSHTKGSYDQMRDYQMNMVTTLVLNKKYNFSHIVFHYMAENITTKVRAWKYPRFVQMLIDHAYPEIDRNIKDDLLVQAHMSNNTLKQLVKYHPNHPEPDLVIESFGFIKDVKYVDPDPVDHQNWRNQEEMKEAFYADELKILENFKTTKNEWYVKESGRRRRLATPTAEQGEGSSSKPKKKQKKKAQTMLVDEPEDDIPIVDVEKEQEVTAGEDLLFDADVLETGPDFVANVVQSVTAEIQKEKEKIVDDFEGDDVDKDTTSSSSSSDDKVVDENERQRRMKEEIEKEKLLRKRKRLEKDDDAPYVPSPEHATESQSTPKVRKKAAGRKRATPKVRVSKRPQKIVQKPPTPPHEPTPPQSPIHQSPPRQPTHPQQSSPPRLPTPPRQPSPISQSTPPQQTFVTSQDLFGTPPLSQMQPGSSSRGLQTPQDNLLEIGDFGFANNDQVLKLEKRMDDVIAENKKLAAENKKVADREKLLAARVQKLESENKELVKKVEADQTKIDILKVRVAELEEEKNRRDDQNEYFKLKNKELAAAKALRDHEFYMLNRVVESMLGTSVNQRFEELKVEDLRAERQAEIERQMKEKCNNSH
ncbi:hypothetical protein HanXRQr2_Chr07g0306991 [Helianthus annuus]|uniref:Uncharacterized protein n=1 Tax=Helianthus annuus TaxID=4232 RepID=A0A9K3NHG6_HELAN|nr:uncharacterized protein LOC110868671 [Helianthus annuus]KAF5799658.1 hypothetical protein HanXRQr2_Chr07g0306991 [Helianthus annuus]